MLYEVYYHHSKYASPRLFGLCFGMPLRSPKTALIASVKQKVLWWNLEDLVLLNNVVYTVHIGVPGLRWGLRSNSVAT